MQSSMVKVFSILLRYFQDTIRNSIELCTQCDAAAVDKMFELGYVSGRTLVVRGTLVGKRHEMSGGGEDMNRWVS